MPQDNERYWHDKEGYGGQGFVQEDQTFDWRAPDTEAYNAYAQQQAATSGGYLDALKRGQDSYGEAMLDRGMGQTSRAMASQAIGRGANPSGERAAIMAGAEMAGQNNANAAALRAQEMQAANMAHMQNLNQLRGGEMGWAQLDAQMQQAAANHYAQMGQNNIARDAETRQVISTAMGGAGGMLGGMLSDERLKAAVMSASPAAQDEIASRFMQNERRMAQHGARMAVGGVDQAMGGALGRVGSALAGVVGPPGAEERGQQRYLKDRRYFVNTIADNARNAVGAEPKMRSAQGGYGDGAGRMYDALADKLDLQRFKYADRARQLGAPDGDRVGVMAQDMEESPLGAQAVNEAPDGTKSIDRDNALGLSLGLHGRAAERIDELEAKLAAMQAQKEGR